MFNKVKVFGEIKADIKVWTMPVLKEHHMFIEGEFETVDPGYFWGTRSIMNDDWVVIAQNAYENEMTIYITSHHGEIDWDNGYSISGIEQYVIYNYLKYRKDIFSNAFEKATDNICQFFNKNFEIIDILEYAIESKFLDFENDEDKIIANLYK